MTICTTLEAPLFLRALKSHCWSRHFNYRRTGQGGKWLGLRRNQWPHKERLRSFPRGYFLQASHRKRAQSSWHAAVFTPLQPPTVPTPLRHHHLHHEHHSCQFTSSWDGRCPHSCVTSVQEAGAAPSPHRAPVCLLGPVKFVIHKTVAALQLDVGAQPGACCNTTGIPKESFPILQSELDNREPFPSKSAIEETGKAAQTILFWCHRLEKDGVPSTRGAKN